MAPPLNPYTPSRPPRIDLAVPDNVDTWEGLGDCSPFPCLGGPILSPRQNKDCTQGVSWVDVEQLAAPDYHGKTGGVTVLTASFLEKCGYHMILSNDVVTNFNNIISAHRCIGESWHNPGINMYGPQVNRILLKYSKCSHNWTHRQPMTL
jgi:hypothetical protein